MKKYFAVLVACVVLMCLNVEAQGEPKVTIYGAASGIPNSVVAEIVAENPDAQEITFLKWENAVLDNELVMPLAGWTYSDIVVKTESTNVTLADKFIISVANEEESLDAVSDACLMLMKRISTLRQLSDMSLRRYIIITVEHASINRLRRMKRINQYSFTVDEECTQELAANEMPIEEQIIIAAEKQRLKKAIQKLSEKEQWILSMRFDEELTYKQIAQQIGVKPQNIGGILERTYKHLRRILEEVELN